MDFTVWNNFSYASIIMTVPHTAPAALLLLYLHLKYSWSCSMHIQTVAESALLVMKEGCKLKYSTRNCLSAFLSRLVLSYTPL
jgi:hypothetical protein